MTKLYIIIIKEHLHVKLNEEMMEAASKIEFRLVATLQEQIRLFLPNLEVTNFLKWWDQLLWKVSKHPSKNHDRDKISCHQFVNFDSLYLINMKSIHIKEIKKNKKKEGYHLNMSQTKRINHISSWFEIYLCCTWNHLKKEKI